MNPTGTTGTTGTDAAVTIAEIAEFLRRLRSVTQAAADPTRDTSAERAAFLVGKADLFTRIAAQHPDLIPPSPTDIGPA